MKKFLPLLLVTLLGCDNSYANPKSASGVSKANVTIPVGPDGFTAEQRNIRDRLLKDNEPGAIKHLYVISAYSGQVLIYSTVKGKVTSGSKRLAPNTVEKNQYSLPDGFTVHIGNESYLTDEVLSDDGTYGSSGDYLFWWDVKGVYHQHYVQGGQIVHISSEPLAVKSITINMELKGASEGLDDSTKPDQKQDSHK